MREGNFIQTLRLCRCFHVFLRLLFEFLPALVGTEKIFSSGKLGLEFRIFVVDFCSANRISRHCLSLRGNLSPFAERVAKILPFACSIQVAERVYVPAM